ncbi:alpha/beta hydrolase fold-3 domain-containing protein [Mytilinidion resinicola]|uniref:Alpha/beta hydrolase fold-3 domain-containing protein n=1 Tax=Mytilinidion resinicola TaxID=574789 RepID=A0A6A6YI06_9PEZI|nr:alpha/beta hydrolase fold-3 domain-containing protein [Mytilinidion resinicola]KAF2808466.1 alpha/beta hydrolase fold-3 domain-containing protein [Mytilinidion resinicola]
MAAIPAPPYDAELSVALAQLPTSPTFSKEILPMLRQFMTSMYNAEKAIAGRHITLEERTIPGPHGDINISIFKPSASTDKPRPGIYFIHGGGMFTGNRFLGSSFLCDWVEQVGAVGVSVEYRLAPEHPYPVPLDDCYAGLKWVGEHLGELGIDPDRLMLAGQSAGGGLSASLALTVRDKGGPKLRALCLICPMLDDHNNSLSARQYATVGTWNQEKSAFGWSCLLGDQAGSEGVSPYAAAARATDLSGLPPTFLDVGSAEPFRDEVVAFAGAIWKDGGKADLHVWDGAFHGFDMLVPSAKLSVAAVSTRLDWVKRVL